MAPRLSAALTPRSPLSLLATVVALAGIPALLLPFTWETTPLDAVSSLPFLRGGGGLWPIGVPFLLAVPVSMAAIRRLLSGRLSRAERLAAYLAALVAACCFLCIYLPGGTSPSNVWSWLLFAFGLMAPAAGGYLLWRNRRVGVSDVANAIAAMQVTYVIVAFFCLISFAPDWQIGAYLVAVTTVAYLVQIVALCLATPRRTGALPLEPAAH